MRSMVKYGQTILVGLVCETLSGLAAKGQKGSVL